MTSIASTVTQTTGSYAGIKPIRAPVVSQFFTDLTPDTETTFTKGPIKQFEITNRGNVVVKLSYQAGQSGTIYRSLYPNAPYEVLSIDDQTISFYVQAPAASQRLEIVTWL